jgi:signal peptide peptidase SppA
MLVSNCRFWAIQPYFQYINRINQVLLNEMEFDEDKKLEEIYATEEEELTIINGIAIITVSGVLFKRSWFLTDMIDLQNEIFAAFNSSKVRGILLRVESPGGEVFGLYELISQIKNVQKIKPVRAYIEDVGASAAYRVAAVTERIGANYPAEVGSIGTYAVVADYSEYVKKEGIKIHIIKTGKYKGLGEMGSEVTKDQLAYVEKRVEELNDMFIADIATGRNMSIDAVRAVADGRTYLATEAKNLKLIDDVTTFDQMVADFVESIDIRKKARSLNGRLRLQKNS